MDHSGKRIVGAPLTAQWQVMAQEQEDEGFGMFEDESASDPRKMPRHFFIDCLWLGFDAAVRADITKQNYSVIPRYWYVPASFRCRDCGKTFTFSVQEQRVWFEEYRLLADASPVCCLPCRRKKQDIKRLKQEYDREITAALASKEVQTKSHLIELIDLLLEAGPKDQPQKMRDNRQLLARQLEKLSGGQQADATDRSSLE